MSLSEEMLTNPIYASSLVEERLRIKNHVVFRYNEIKSSCEIFVDELVGKAYKNAIDKSISITKIKAYIIICGVNGVLKIDNYYGKDNWPKILEPVYISEREAISIYEENFKFNISDFTSQYIVKLNQKFENYGYC